jgi:ubiquinone/menaquinone biosynthesis C-methylase UbiE
LVRDLSISEIEDLGYYDFMAYLKVPFFNIGGTPSLDLLAQRCGINENSHVLDVGCGTGGNSAYLAEMYGSQVTGIDISGLMVERANDRAISTGLEDRLSFSVGNAYDLDFPDGTFDMVMTVFVSQLLDLKKVFPEFIRVLKDGGKLGINEMYRADYVPENLISKVDAGEEVYQYLTELPFSIRTPSVWEAGFRNSGFTDVSVESFTNVVSIGKGLDMIQDFGGWSVLLSSLWQIVKLGVQSGKMREKFGKMSKGKRVLLNDRETAEYIGYVLGVGRKG